MSRVREPGIGSHLMLAMAMISICTLPAHAQDQAGSEPPPKPWGNEAEASFVRTGGNSSAETFAFSNHFFYNWTYSELVIDLSALRAQSDTRQLFNVDGAVVEETTTETTAEQYQAEARYRHNVVQQIFWFVAGAWQRDEFSGIDSRLEGIGGVGYRFVENARGKIVGEVGAGITRENRTSGVSDTFAEARGGIDVEWELTDTTDLASSLELIANVQDFGDHRIHSNSSVTVSINDHLALRAGFTLKFDNEPVVILVDELPGPPVPFVLEKTDTRLSTSLVVSF